MEIIVNGERKNFAENATLFELISDLKIEDKVMASAVNMEIVKKENWKNFKLKSGDKVATSNFVGGG